jgi:hypothetical protein
VGETSAKTKTPARNVSKKVIKPEWRIEDGLLQFWDGTQYLVGKKRGFYELFGVNHYWAGKEWWIPEEVGPYNLKGKVYNWNGTSWD